MRFRQTMRCFRFSVELADDLDADGRAGRGNIGSGGPAPGAPAGMPGLGTPGFGMLGALGGLPPPQSLGLPPDTPPDIIRAALIAGMRPNMQVCSVSYAEFRPHMDAFLVTNACTALSFQARGDQC
jgi:hypothetical protein